MERKPSAFFTILGVIVAGAGIIGLACSWSLALKGFDVTIFDSGKAASEASWAGAGMLAPGGEFSEASPLTTMALRSRARYSGFVEALTEATGAIIDYQTCGAVELALNEAEAVAMEDRAAKQALIGIRSEPFAANDFAAARFYPDDALVDPRDVTAALRTACLARNVTILEHEPVVEIFPDGSGVRTSRGTYRGEGVLIAAGAWSSRLCSTLPYKLPATMPIRGHLAAYSLPPGLLGPIRRRRHTYLLQRRSGLLIAGSSTEEAGFDRTLDEAVLADIHARASVLLPDLAPLKPVERWNGLRSGIEGGVPLIGNLRDTRIWTAFGHYRNGILLAPETAAVIADSVAAEL